MNGYELMLEWGLLDGFLHDEFDEHMKNTLKKVAQSVVKKEKKNKPSTNSDLSDVYILNNPKLYRTMKKPKKTLNNSIHVFTPKNAQLSSAKDNLMVPDSELLFNSHRNTVSSQASNSFSRSPMKSAGSKGGKKKKIKRKKGAKGKAINQKNTKTSHEFSPNSKQKSSKLIANHQNPLSSSLVHAAFNELVETTKIKSVLAHSKSSQISIGRFFSKFSMTRRILSLYASF